MIDLNITEVEKVRVGEIKTSSVDDEFYQSIYIKTKDGEIELTLYADSVKKLLSAKVL